VVGAGEGDERERGALPERAGRPLDRTSFRARMVLAARERRGAEAGSGAPAVTARGIAGLVRGLPLERKVAQLFLRGFEGTDASTEIFRRLSRLDLGGLVVASENYSDPAQLAALSGEAGVVSEQAGHVPPWVLAVQDGGDFNELPGLPPPTPPADLGSADDAEAQATEAATTLRDLNVTRVLGPVVDVGFESGSALGERVYSDDAAEVAAYADAVVHAYRAERLFGAAKHFPGLGAADQPTRSAPPASASTSPSCATAT
jgi:beta-glucosidase-like glycosyl hydrolase